MSRTNTDRNLLFGILAVQMDFVGRNALIEAMNAWVLSKDKPLAEILAAQGALSSERRTLLEALVQEHLKEHDNDPARSLAAVSSIGSARKELERIADSDLHASLVQLDDRTIDQGTYATRAPSAQSVGESTSTGTRFRILRPHARGGLGEIFVAEDQELHREVALKEMQDRHADNPTSRSRFVLEAEVTGGLEHPGIVPVYGLGQYADGRPFYAMRFIRGDSLKDAIERFHKAGPASRDEGERTLELRKLLQRFLDVCNAVAYAHSRGVLHRDLKPANIMLGKFGETLVVDWGLAKPLGRPEQANNQDERPLQPSSGGGSAETVAGTAVGTPQYMSPEQAAGRLDLLGPASDVYSLGATLYSLLTGRPAFTDSDVLTALHKVKKGDFPAPRLVKREVAPALEAICLKAMALKPEDRYPSPRELAEDVEHWLADERVSALPETATQRLARWGRRHRTLTRAATAALALVAVVAVLATIIVNTAWRAEQDARDREQAARHGDEEAFRQSVGHLNEMLVLISDGELRDVRGLDPLRKKLDAYSHALARQHGDDPRLQPEAALLYFCLGLLTKRDGSKDEALQEFLRAKTICQKLAREAPDVARHRELLARTCLERGILCRSLGNSAEAATEYELALAELTRLCAAEAGNLGYQRQRAEVLHNQADLQDSLGEWNKALALYQASIDIRDGLVASQPKDVNFRRDQARGYGYIGDVYAELCRWKNAEEAYRKADDIRQALFDENTGNAEAKWQLARSFNNTAVLYRSMGRSAEALKMFEKPLKMFDELAAANPEVKDYRDDLGWSLNRVGALRTDLSDPANSGRAELERAQAIYEQLLGVDPNDVSYQSGLAWSLAYLGKSYAGQDPRRALDYLGKALPKLDKLAADRFDADNLYNLALAEALIAELDRKGEKRDRLIAQALGNLEKATQRGEIPVSRIENDRAFQVLRTRAPFKKLLEKLKTEDKAKGRA